jgi:hypothetical protein
MFSLLQYLGLGKSKQSCQEDPVFQEKMKRARILLNFAALVCHVQSQLGGSFLFEQPWNALSWHEPCIRRLMQHEKHHLVRTDQCMFGQADNQGNLMRKRTGFLTNNPEIAKSLRRTCKNQHSHQPCVGSSQGVRRSTQAARYTGRLIAAVLKAYAKSCNSDNASHRSSLLMSELQWLSHPEGSSQATQVTRKLSVQPHETFQVDQSSPEHDMITLDPTEVSVQLIDVNDCEAFALEESQTAVVESQQHPALTEEEDQEVQMLSPSQRRTLIREIEKAHRGMGHPNHSRFLRILKIGKASKAAIGLAKTFRCPQCHESTRPKPWRKAAPPRELSFNEVVGIDTVTVKHYDHNIRCLNIICWGTRYQLIVPLNGATAFDARVAYRQWVKTFGAPKVLKPDMGSEFLGDFMYRCATDGTEVDVTSLESPTQNSITEREGGAFKAMYSKASLDYGPTDDIQEIHELIDVVNMYKNRLCHRSGFSAVQRVFGYSPAIPGDVTVNRTEENNLFHHSRIQAGDITLQKQQKMRECAGRAFFSSECTEAIRRVVYSGHRPMEQFEVGQLVFFWSVGHFNKVAVHHSAARRPNHAFWHGPCRVVATQYPSSIYLSYQGRLVKAAPEQCRRCSEDEDASCSDVLKRLCQVRDELKHAKISGLSDIQGEERPPNPDHPTGKRRHFSKQPPFSAAKQRRIRDAPSVSYEPSLAPTEELPEIADLSDATESMASDQEMFMEVLPFEEYENQESSFDMFPMHNISNGDPNKRAAKEIKLKDLNSHDYELFKQAIQKEWKTNLENGAIRVVPPIEAQRIRQQLSHRIMQSRLLHVAKPVDDASQIEPENILQCNPSIPCKAKSRWVARGDKDPDIFSVCASSPVIHRDTFMMGLQAISSQQWRLHFADFSQAFMQGDQLKREEPLFCEPPERDILGLPHGSLIEICKTVYGLVDAPFRWNQHLDKLFKSMGYTPSILDPCCYLLHSDNSDDFKTRSLDGIIMVATDDLISGGNQRHQALMQQLHHQYKFGKWEFGSGRFCGKDLRQDKDYSIFVSQQYYTEQKCQDRIHVPKGAQNADVCDSDQVKVLREKIGSLSWLAKETRVDLAGSVALLMQSFPCPTIADLKTCNKILKDACLYKDIGIRVRPIAPQDLCIVVSSDAAWANASDDEGTHKSQAGYVVMTTNRKMLQGHECEFTMVSWKSHTLKRRTISTLSAETQGIVESAAVACWYRYLLAEFFYSHLVRAGTVDWETMLEPLEFGVITDAKSVYDALTNSASSSTTDKRTAIDLAIIREYLRRHNGCVRWIDGTVQLADSLTKHMAADFLRSVLQRGRYQLNEEFDTLNLRQKAKQDKQKRKVSQKQ